MELEFLIALPCFRMILLGSWCPGLDENPDALEYLLSDPHIRGVELANLGPELDRIREVGLIANLHNFTRWGVASLGAQNFIEGNFGEWLADPSKHPAVRSNGPVLGFHLPRYVMSSEMPEVQGRIAAQVGWLERAFPSFGIAVEAPPAYTRLSSDERLCVAHMLPPGCIPAGSVEFLQAIDERIGAGRAGHLIDISHLLVSIEQTLRPSSWSVLLDAFRMVVRPLSGRIRQIHINAPSGDLVEGLVDAHEPISLSGNRHLVLDALQIVTEEMAILREDVEVAAVTIEVHSGLAPVEHVQVLSRDAALLGPMFR